MLHTYSKAKKDALTSKKIEGVRALNEFIAMTNSVSEKRIGVVFDAHSMNINAQNALLKTLEELPENKHIFIVSNQRKYFLPTIYSRSSLISIRMRPLILIRMRPRVSCIVCSIGDFIKLTLFVCSDHM